MNLGVCFAIFIVVALILLFLFCLLLKWFEYLRKKRSSRHGLEFRTLQETIEAERGENYQGAYQQYCERKSQRNRELNDNLLEKNQMIDFSLKQQITKISNDLYGISSLRQKLNRQLDEREQFIAPKMFALKDLKFDRIKTMETNADSKSQRIRHEFIKKLVCYSRQGINIVEVEVQSLTKREEKVILKKKVQQNFIQNEDPSFQFFLQSLGFQNLAYTCFKLICNVNTTTFKNNSTYSFKGLDVEQNKSEITFSQYEKLLDKIKNSELLTTNHSQ